MARPKTKRGRGRPTLLTPEMAEKVVRRLAVDPISVVFADPEMPGRRTYYGWLLQDKDFFDRAHRARAIGAFRHLDDAEQKLADAETRNDLTGAQISLLRERLHHARWTIKMLWPRLYSQSVKLAGAGKGGEHILRVVLDDDDDDGGADRDVD